MRWCFDAGHHPLADEILDDLGTATSEAVVPVLWRYEVSAVLARGHIKGVLPGQDAEQFIEDLQALPIHLDHDAGERVFSDVYRLAVAYRLTSYDAAYLELAQRRDLPLATFDAELIAACKSAGVDILRR